MIREASDQVPPQLHRLLGRPELFGRLRRYGQGHGCQRGRPPALTLQQPLATVDVSSAAACHQQSSLATLLRVKGSSIEAPQLRIRCRWVQPRPVLTQLLLTKHHRQETHCGRPDEQRRSEMGPCRHVIPESDAIVWPRLRPAMPSSRPGRSQRWRTLLVLLTAMTIWAFRWVWPLQMLPGWVLALMLAWAGIELIALIWKPHRWR